MDTRALKLAALAICIHLAACSDSDQKTAEEASKAILHSPAFAGITDSIEKDPNDVRLLLTRATRLSQHNFHRAATADYKKAYELTGDPALGLDYTSNLLLTNDVKEAMAVLQEGNKKFPDNTEFSRRLAEIYLQRGDAKKALAEFDTILARDSSNFEAWYDKGTLFLRQQDTTRAVEALERSFSLMPINHTGMALANIYVARKDPRALEISDFILERDTAGVQTDPVFMKGIYYTETGDYDKAIAQFDECIRRDWKMTDAYIEKGIIFYERKQLDEALKVFELASTVSNTDADVYYWMGRCYEAKGNTEEAITNYRRALALDDTFTEAKVALRRLN